jgi:hypothetical protein
MFSARASSSVLINDLIAIMANCKVLLGAAAASIAFNSPQTLGFTAEAVEDNVCEWDVRFTTFPPGS